MQLEWNKVSIDVNEDGHVYYYFNDILRHTERHAQYSHGTIRMGLGCRNYHFKDITVEKPLPTQKFSKEIQMNSDNFKIMNGAKFNGDMLNVKHGNGFVETYQNFQRPFSVSVMMKQDESVDWHHKHRPECGVIQVFPQNNNRHTGYNAGTNWWAHQFGAGVDGAIGGRGSMQGRELEWNTVKVTVHEKRVEYYLNGNLMYTAYDTQYQEGTIRMGYGCRTFHFKDFVITTDQQPTSAPTESPTKNPTESPTKNPTESPTKSPTERCAADNCMNWSCADWCECYDESKLDVYNSYPECQDDNDDTCICFDKEESEMYGERHRKINYNQDAVDAGTAKMIKGTNVHVATKQNHMGGYHLTCGRHNPRECKEADKVTMNPNEKHEVRCCSDVAPTAALKKKHTMKNCATPHSPGPSVKKAGARLPGIPGVWGMSKVGGSNGNSCVHRATFTEARDICAAIPNGRLCTETELKGECTSHTGCMHDLDLIWVLRN